MGKVYHFDVRKDIVWVIKRLRLMFMPFSRDLAFALDKTPVKKLFDREIQAYHRVKVEQDWLRSEQ